MTLIGEAKLYLKLSHENLPKLSGMLLQYNKISACLAPFDGVCMYILLQRSPQKIDALRISIIEQVISLTQYLHSTGNLVRNFYLGNFFLVKSGIIKLCNMTDVVPKCEHAKSLVGTRPRLPPECREKSGFSVAADTWSIGWLGLLIWTKNTALEGGKRLNISDLYVNDSADFYHVLYNLLKVNPESRPLLPDVLAILTSIMNLNDTM